MVQQPLRLELLKQRAGHGDELGEYVSTLLRLRLLTTRGCASAPAAHG